VGEADVTVARMRPNRTTSSSGPEANPVPLIVNGDPGTATEEPSEAIVGAVVEPTANGVVLLAPPAGDVTLSGPVVAPAGTWTLNMVVLAATTAAGVPLKLTASWLAVALKAVPYTFTVAPGAPRTGSNPS